MTGQQPMRPMMEQPGVRPGMRPPVNGIPGQPVQFRPAATTPGIPQNIRPVSPQQQANLVSSMQNMHLRPSSNSPNGVRISFCATCTDVF